MGFADEILAALPFLRSQAEELMTDQCVIRRPTGEVVTDPVTLEPIPTYVVVYDPDDDPHRGKCKLQTYEGHEAARQIAGAAQVVQRSSIHLPAGAYITQPGDIATMLAARDSLLIGKSFRMVQEYPVKSHATAYRVFVDDNIGSVVPPVEGVP